MKHLAQVVTFAIAIAFLSIAHVRADEQPPYDTPDPAVSENFRNIYLSADSLTRLTSLFNYTLDSSSNLFCIDSPTLCVDSLTHQIVVATSAASSPTITFKGDRTTGFRGSGVQSMSAIANGSTIFNVDADAIHMQASKAVSIANGTLSLPSFNFENETTLGLYRPQSGAMALGISGTKILEASGSSITATAPVSITASANQIVLGTTTLTLNAVAPAAARVYTLPEVGADASFVMTAGNQSLAGIKTFSSGIAVPFGTAGAATGSIYATNDTNTGILWDSSGDDFRIFVNGAQAMRMVPSTTVLSVAGSNVAQAVAGAFQPNNDNTTTCGATGQRWSAVWAANGTIQTSAYKQKRDVKELVSDSDAKTFQLVDVSTPDAPVSIASATPAVPRGVIFKWKDKAGTENDRDYIGFLADDLPLEAHPKKDDGTLDMENVYTTSVVGILCSNVRDLQRQVVSLQSEVRKLKDKVK